MNRLKSLAKAFVRRDVVYESWDDRFHLYNFWKIDRTKVQDVWLYNFINYHQLIPQGKKLSFVSVFGNRDIVHFIRKPKIFFTGENIHTSLMSQRFNQYDRSYLAKFDLALGFDDASQTNLDNYIRFPLWIMYLIPFDATLDVIEGIIAHLNRPTHRAKQDRTIFASNISRHDKNGIRANMIDYLKDIAPVACAGDFMNNTDILKRVYDDDKLAYLRSVAFNICPENSNQAGYVTEKVFESIQAGCIPIYWGGEGDVESEILTKEAIIYLDPENTEEAIKQVAALWNDDDAYARFIEIPPFTKDAATIIWDKLQLLKAKIEVLFHK